MFGPLYLLTFKITSLSDDKLIPKTFALHQNYPNPVFNPYNSIQYGLICQEILRYQIEVYDVLGRLVKNLVDNNQNAGFKSIQWDATNNFGGNVSSGVYLYSIKAGDFYQTRKMIIIK